MLAKPSFRDFGPEGEEQFQFLIGALELGEGFQLIFVSSISGNTLDEVERRIMARNSAETPVEVVSFSPPSSLDRITEEFILNQRPNEPRRIILVRASGAKDELRAGWTHGLVLLNEQRNRFMKSTPHAFVIQCPQWLPQLAMMTAPDFWSVRSLVVSIPDTIDAETVTSQELKSESWPRNYALEDGEKYTSLAEGLRENDTAENRRLRIRLLLKAADSFLYRAELGHVLSTANEVKKLAAKTNDEESGIHAEIRIAQAFRRQGKLKEALKVLTEKILPYSLKIPNSTIYAGTLIEIADVELALGNRESALMGYEESLRIRRRTLQSFGESPESLRALSVTLNRVGDVELALGNRESARMRYEECLGIARRILQSFGESPESLRDVAVPLYKLAIYYQDSDLNKSLSHATEARDISSLVLDRYGRIPQAITDLEEIDNLISELRRDLSSETN